MSEDIAEPSCPASTRSHRRVVIVGTALRHYRVRFYELLRRYLAEHDVVLEVIYSEISGWEAGRGDTVELDWARRVDHRTLKMGRYEVTWQPCLGALRGADMVIVQQAMRRLLNYILIAWQFAGGPSVAFWGHGRNFQATTSLQSITEYGKDLLTRQAHWFFAYNDLSEKVLRDVGFPPDRISVVNNSVDTRALAAARDRVTERDRRNLRKELGLESEHIGIYVGAMYREKRLPFLVEAAKEIRTFVPDFELICVGSGVERDVIEKAAAENEWIHYVGPKFGDDLARLFSLARVFLLPGLVGLAVLDSFVFGVPIVTCEDALHSPEIDYLESGINGLMVPGDGSAGRYARTVSDLLVDDDIYERMVEGCRASADVYTIEAMARRFADGVLRALDA